MSNHLAIAGVTATLTRLLGAAVDRDLPGAQATAGRPDVPLTSEPSPDVRVFLFRATPNAARGTDDLPTRGADAGLVQRPQLALTLNYLLTFIGDDALHQPQRLLGICARTLHFHPILTRGEIESMVADASGTPLADVDLAQQGLVRLTPMALTVEELANLWNALFRVEYRLSMVFQADVVLLTPPEAPVRALPVRERRLFASTILRPRIQAVTPEGGPGAPLLPGTEVTISGTDLAGEEATVVRFGDATAAHELVGGTIVAEVPADVVAGAVGVVIEHTRSMGEPPTPRPAGRSNVFPVVVHPAIRPAGTGHAIVVEDDVEDPAGIHAGVLAITLDPPVGQRQEVSVLLNAVGGDDAFSFPDDRRDGEGEPDTTNELRIAYAGVPAGDYLVRVVVGGAESLLEVATTGPAEGTYDAPRVAIP